MKINFPLDRIVSNVIDLEPAGLLKLLQYRRSSAKYEASELISLWVKSSLAKLIESINISDLDHFSR